MQDVQYHEVTPRTDGTAGLHNINPRHLTRQELHHYATLVAYDKLPEAWKEELAKRAMWESTSAQR